MASLSLSARASSQRNNKNNTIACTKTDKLAFATFETQFCLRVAPFSCCTLGSSTCATGKLSASRPTHTEPTPRPVCSPCDCGVKAARGEGNKQLKAQGKKANGARMAHANRCPAKKGLPLL